jgi:periplasmic divalent cation tolerance protein
LRWFSVIKSGMSDVRVVLCTFPDVESARQIGTALVEMQLAACVNIVPVVESIYRWQGKVESAQEVLAIIKTSATAFPALEQELKTLHPYDCPEIIAIQPDAVSASYAAWLMESVGNE